MRRALRAFLFLSMASSLAGFGSCRKPDDSGESKSKKKDELPTAATPVLSTMLGIG